ncbi:MAG: NADH-quinone oxidoreductase subunit N [Thermoanaerobaculum sp.]|nr:NADH-quinone oxidoreductase subunit N [Thermoanaerobaculum sp.]MDW7966625.1 NADH-quinone oxidoreductase subunit N [Thermoanaerobaculum sp.]
MALWLESIVPELILIGVGALLVLGDAFARRWRPAFPWITLAGVLAALGSRWLVPAEGLVWEGVLAVDSLGRFVDSYILAAAALALLMADPFLARTQSRFGEFYGLLLWAAAGAMAMAKANHLLVVFVGLELLSIALYVLNAFLRDNILSLEAGWKYLVVGGFSSGLFLFGAALLYGATGTLYLPALLTAPVTDGFLMPMALALLASALAFKLAVFPFHAWAPDVYQGSPTPVTAFLSVVPKGAALVVLARLIAAASPQVLAPRWTAVLAGLAVGSMVLGNLAALAQRDLKRMLAYSGIAHMGYALVGLVAYGAEGVTGVLVYLAAYTFMNMAAFAAVAAFSESEEEPHLVNDLAGQGWERPVVAFALSLSMFALAGIPPTIGFVGKFLVFRAAVNAHMVWLAVVGVLASLVSVFYYVRVVYYLYMKPLPKRKPAFAEPWPIKLLSAACVVAIVVLGVFPQTLVRLAQEATGLLGR